MATIRQRGNKWQVQVRKAGFPPESKSFSTKAAAEHWAKSRETNIERGIAGLPTDQMTVGALMEKWQKEVAPWRKGWRWDNTRINYFLANWPRHVLDLDVNHQQIVPSLRKYKDDRMAAGISGSSINREMSLISAIFSHASKEGWIELRSNPISLISRPAENKPRRQRCTDEQMEKIVGPFPDKPPVTSRDFLPFIAHLALETAMRLGEVCQLRWEDIDTKRRTVHVRDEWVPGQGGLSVKNGSDRDVPLSSKAIQLIQTIAASADEEATDIFPITKEYAGVLWRQATKAAGLEQIHFHDLRREATTRIAAKVKDPMTLSAITGHKDLRVLVSTYYKPNVSEFASMLD